MMDNETGYGLEKKFGCVKIGTLRDTSCTVSSNLRININLSDELFNSYR